MLSLILLLAPLVWVALIRRQKASIFEVFISTKPILAVSYHPTGSRVLTHGATGFKILDSLGFPAVYVDNHKMPLNFLERRRIKLELNKYEKEDVKQTNQLLLEAFASRIIEDRKNQLGIVS
jgi:hypothetical protein